MPEERHGRIVVLQVLPIGVQEIWLPFQFIHGVSVRAGERRAEVWGGHQQEEDVRDQLSVRPLMDALGEIAQKDHVVRMEQVHVEEYGMHLFGMQG